MFPGVTPGLDDCTDGLDDAQLTLMAATYGLGPNAALLAKRAAATTTPAPGAPRTISSFGPARLLAMLGGDALATRSFVELLFHLTPGRAPASRPTGG